MWDLVDAALIRVSDELRADDMVGDATWNMLSRHYTTPQLVDIIVSSVGYRIVGGFVNTVGVQMDRGAERAPVD